MNKNITAKIAKYEESLREAERSIEEACRSICSLRGPFPHRQLHEALGTVQDLIRGAWKFYDNPEVEEA